MIKYTDNISKIAPEELTGFFEGWRIKPSKEKHYELLKNSDFKVIAVDETEHRVIGFITAITDNVLAAYIPFLEVLPEYKSQGIGSELMRRMLNLLKNFYMIDLCCDEGLEGFYKEFGMNEVSGMVLRNYENQSGR